MGFHQGYGYGAASSGPVPQMPVPEQFVSENPEIPHVHTRVAGRIAKQMAVQVSREGPGQRRSKQYETRENR